jgi:hypothetical protein
MLHIQPGPSKVQALTCLLVQEQIVDQDVTAGCNITNYPWILSLHSLTSLSLFTDWPEPQQVQHSIADLAQHLQQLQSLSLADINMHPASRICWRALAPLAVCSLLTRLELDNFELCDAAGVAVPGDDAVAVDSAAQHPHGQPAQQYAGLPPFQQAGEGQQAFPAAAAAAGNGLSEAPQTALLLPLLSLQELHLSSSGWGVWRCPLSLLAPNITKLQHVSGARRGYAQLG